MKNLKLTLGLIVLVTLFFQIGCEKSLKVVLIRVENGTEHDMTDVFVSGPEDDHEYGDLAAGEKSEYQLYAKAYRYAFCTFKIGDSTYTVQPIDFVGESFLDPGEYTYRLSVFNLDTPWAGLELVE